MFCTSCGKELPGDALFCPYCGAKVSVKSGFSNNSDSDTEKNGFKNVGQNINNATNGKAGDCAQDASNFFTKNRFRNSIIIGCLIICIIIIGVGKGISSSKNNIVDNTDQITSKNHESQVSQADSDSSVGQTNISRADATRIFQNYLMSLSDDESYSASVIEVIPLGRKENKDYYALHFCQRRFDNDVEYYAMASINDSNRITDLNYVFNNMDEVVNTYLITTQNEKQEKAAKESGVKPGYPITEEVYHSIAEGDMAIFGFKENDGTKYSLGLNVDDSYTFDLFISKDDETISSAHGSYEFIDWSEEHDAPTLSMKVTSGSSDKFIGKGIDMTLGDDGLSVATIDNSLEEYDAHYPFAGFNEYLEIDWLYDDWE